MFYERTFPRTCHFYERSSRRAQNLNENQPLSLRRRDALHDLGHGLPLLPDDEPLRELRGNYPQLVGVVLRFCQALGVGLVAL